MFQTEFLLWKTDLVKLNRKVMKIMKLSMVNKTYCKTLLLLKMSHQLQFLSVLIQGCRLKLLKKHWIRSCLLWIKRGSKTMRWNREGLNNSSKLKLTVNSFMKHSIRWKTRFRFISKSNQISKRINWATKTMFKQSKK